MGARRLVPPAARCAARVPSIGRVRHGAGWVAADDGGAGGCGGCHEKVENGGRRDGDGGCVGGEEQGRAGGEQCGQDAAHACQRARRDGQ